jgi:predicted kinase
MDRVAAVHLICGAIGAGKTTYSIALALRTGAIRLSMDDWMQNLFFRDRPDPHGIAWFLERTARCELQMWELTEAIIERGVDVVLDVGLARLEDRDRCRGRGMQTKGTVKLHYLDVDAETRRARVRLRNVERAGTEALQVTDAMFDFMERWFEPPTDDELYGAMIVG